jgi:type II secretory pathway pseudopilin PulG
MKLAQRAAVLGAGAAMLVGATLAVSTPASASGGMSCNPVTSGGTNYAVCTLFGAATPSNSKWTFNGSYASYDDNATYVRFACGGTGGTWTVSATWTDSTGVTLSGSARGTCGAITP